MASTVAGAFGNDALAVPLSLATLLCYLKAVRRSSHRTWCFFRSAGCTPPARGATTGASLQLPHSSSSRRWRAGACGGRQVRRRHTPHSPPRVTHTSSWGSCSPRTRWCSPSRALADSTRCTRRTAPSTASVRRIPSTLSLPATSAATPLVLQPVSRPRRSRAQCAPSAPCSCVASLFHRDAPCRSSHRRVPDGAAGRRASRARHTWLHRAGAPHGGVHAATGERCPMTQHPPPQPPGRGRTPRTRGSPKLGMSLRRGHPTGCQCMLTAPLFSLLHTFSSGYRYRGIPQAASAC
jgi:hypothetical protein